VFGSHDRRGKANRLQDVEINAGITLNVRFFGKKKDERISALLNELPRHDEAVAAIVAFAAKDADRQIFEVFEARFEFLDDTHAGVFHEKDAWYSELGRGEPVDFADLFCAEDFHMA